MICNYLKTTIIIRVNKSSADLCDRAKQQLVHFKHLIIMPTTLQQKRDKIITCTILKASDIAFALLSNARLVDHINLMLSNTLFI